MAHSNSYGGWSINLDEKLPSRTITSPFSFCWRLLEASAAGSRASSEGALFSNVSMHMKMSTLEGYGVMEYGKYTGMCALQIFLSSL